MVVLIKNHGFTAYDDVIGAFTPYNAQPLEDVHSENTNGNPVPVVGAWASKEIVFESNGYTDELIQHSSGRPITFALTLRKSGAPVVVYTAVLPRLATSLPRQEHVQHGTEKPMPLSFVHQGIGRN